MTRRPQRWQAEKARTAKALRELVPACATPGCKGKAMGTLAKLDPFRLLLACPKCAAEALKAQREKRT